VRHRCFGNLLGLLLLCGALLTYACAQSERQPELLVVYWGADDCSWCTWWEHSSGLKQAFEKSSEFKNLTFRVIKKPSISEPYVASQIPKDLDWLTQRMARQEETPPELPPTWAIYFDRRPVLKATGSRQWQQTVWPEIQKLVQLQRRTDSG